MPTARRRVPRGFTPCLLYTSCEQVCPSSSLRAYDASVENKGIVVVSRASEAARAAGAVSSEDVYKRQAVHSAPKLDTSPAPPFSFFTM